MCSCKKSTANENYSVRKTKKCRLPLLSNCGVCDEKKINVVKDLETSRLKIIFKWLSLKWKKLLANFYWLEISYAWIAFKTARTYL